MGHSGGLILALSVVLSAMLVSAGLMANANDDPVARATPSAFEEDEFEIAPASVYIGEEVTFWANFSSTTGSNLTFTILYDAFLESMAPNPDSPVTVNVTGNPGSIVQKFTYNNPGNISAGDYTTCYFVRLWVDDGSENKSYTRYVLVKENSPPQFVYDLPAELSAPLGSPMNISVQIIDPDDDAVNILWEFGDGTTASNATDGTFEDRYVNQSHTWDPYVEQGTGNYYIQFQMNVTATDSLENSRTLSATVSVYVPYNFIPEISLTASVTQVEVGEELHLFANATDAEGESLTWTFNYSDGTYDVFHTDWSEPGELVWCNLTHVYDAVGVYIITMHVSDALDGNQVFPHNTSADLLITVDINEAPGVSSSISVMQPLPVIIEEAIGFIEVGLIIQAMDVDGDVLTASWYLDDAVEPIVNVSAGGTLIYTFIQYMNLTEPGSYNVSVVVTDGHEGHEVTRSCVIDAISDNRPPNLVSVDMSYPSSHPTFAFIGEPVYYMVEFSDIENDTLELAIDFCDGTPILHANLTEYINDTTTFLFSHAFPYADDFEIIVNYTDNQEGFFVHEKSFSIYTEVLEDAVPPTADAGQNQIVPIGQMVLFNGSGSEDAFGIANYTWSFMYDEELVSMFGVGPSFVFMIPGAYDVTLNVTDLAGNHGLDMVTIIAYGTVNDPPVADAGPDQTVSVGDEVTFNGSGSSDDSGAIADYTWTFVYDGGEEELYGETPSFVFLIPGEYEVTLNVTDFGGNYDTDTVTITVDDIVDNPPVADAGLDWVASVGDEVIFNGSGSSDDGGEISNYTWTFIYDDEVKELYGEAPSFEFLIPGEYEVTLNVTDLAGNYDTDMVIITVLEAIPEFPNVLMPIIGIIVVAAVLISARRGRS